MVSTDDKYLEKIKAKGWEAQHKELSGHGHTDAELNHKGLKKHNGDVALAKKYLDDRKAKGKPKKTEAEKKEKKEKKAKGEGKDKDKEKKDKK